MKKLILLLTILFSTTVQAYPDKPVQIVTPVQAGSGTDIVARILAEHLKTKYNQTFIVVNKPGASTTLGSRHFIDNTKPDGYTLFFAAQSVISSLTTAENLSFKEFNDKLLLLAVINETPQVLLVNPSRYKTLEELQKAENVKYAIISKGGPGQITSEIIKPNTTDILYKGNPDAILGLIRNDVDFFSAPINGAISQIKNGSLSIILTFTKNRLSLFPNIPTFEEVGYDQLDFKLWTGIFVKKEIPKEIIDSLKTSIEEIKLNKSFLTNLPFDIMLPNLSFDELKLLIQLEYKQYEKAYDRFIKSR